MLIKKKKDASWELPFYNREILKFETYFCNRMVNEKLRYVMHIVRLDK